MLPLRVRVYLGSMVMKEYSEFSSITGTSPSDCLVSYQDIVEGGVLPYSKDAVGVFYSPSRLGRIFSV